jgi:hypothetical protein
MLVVAFIIGSEAIYNRCAKITCVEFASECLGHFTKCPQNASSLIHSYISLAKQAPR